VDPVPERVLHLEVRQPDGRRFDASIVVDASIRGLSRGGLSLSTERDASLLARVSRARTLQHGLLGIPFGGAAATIRSPMGVDSSLRKILLDAFAQSAGPFIATQAFVPEAEIGIDVTDVHDLVSRCGLQMTRREKIDDPGDYVGQTVALAAIASLRKAGVRPGRATASVEGFGKVGSAVAYELHERGVRVVAVSTKDGALFDADGLDVPELVPLAERVGDTFVRKYSEADRISAGELRSLAVDLFSPCALPGGIDAQTAGRLRCKVVVPGATVPFKPGGERMLQGRGVAYVPDVLAGCGGVLASNLARAGFTPLGRTRFIESRFPRLVEWLEGQAEQESIGLDEMLAAYCSERFSRMKEDCEAGLCGNGSAWMAFTRGKDRVLPLWLVRHLNARSLEEQMLPAGVI